MTWSRRFSNPRPRNIEQRRDEKGKKEKIQEETKKERHFFRCSGQKILLCFGQVLGGTVVYMNIHLFRSFIERDECCAKANCVNQDDRLPVLREYVTSQEISRIHHAGAKALRMLVDWGKLRAKLPMNRPAFLVPRLFPLLHNQVGK